MRYENSSLKLTLTTRNQSKISSQKHLNICPRLRLSAGKLIIRRLNSDCRPIAQIESTDTEKKLDVATAFRGLFNMLNSMEQKSSLFEESNNIHPKNNHFISAFSHRVTTTVSMQMTRFALFAFFIGIAALNGCSRTARTTVVPCSVAKRHPSTIH